MTDIERFWEDLMDTRRHTIGTIYGDEAASKYFSDKNWESAYKIEKEYFLKNGGQFTNHPVVTKRNKDFFEMCDTEFLKQRANYERTIQQRWHKVQEMPEYKRSQYERDQLKEQIKRAILGDNGKEETADGVHARPNETQGR